MDADSCSSNNDEDSELDVAGESREVLLYMYIHSVEVGMMGLKTRETYYMLPFRGRQALTSFIISNVADSVTCCAQSGCVLADASLHMTSSLSSAARSFRYIYRPTLCVFPTHVTLTTVRRMSDASKTKSEDEWRAILTPEQVRPVPHGVVTGMHSAPPYIQGTQFRVLRLKGTERAGTGEYEHNKAAGIYSCTACNAPLYKSSTKFESGCGWPAFFDGNALSLLYSSRRGKLSSVAVLAIPGAVTRHVDNSLGMERTEITCSACGGHLGHVFKGEGFRTPSGLRFFLAAGETLT